MSKLDTLEHDPVSSSVAMDARDLCELVFTCAGAATGPMLRDNPGYVFPSDDVGKAVALVLHDMTGIDVANVPGYAGMEPIAPVEGTARVTVDLPITEGAYVADGEWKPDGTGWEQEVLDRVKAALTEEQRATLGC